MHDDAYMRLFNVRGRQYDAAMARYPQARDAEFDAAVAIAGIAPGECVADIPCGGGYLGRHLPPGVTLYSVDSSDVFADCMRATGASRFLLAPIDDVPLASGRLDHILSIAGLHHVVDRGPFWQECARLLRQGGVLTVGDVPAGSRVATFLDSVVDRHTATGHRGIYFDGATVPELEACGFSVECAEARRIGWRAESRLALADFCRMLFGLEGITTAELLPRLAEGVGLRETDGGVELDWELMFFRAVRR
ncbi:MAG: Methyltransferase type 11 [Moraxellaceae bacterium]|jgi:SAM-dependent methyltransferase|nr:Methyltransferase type 11 [Moraxellaceae bacterium]